MSFKRWVLSTTDKDEAAQLAEDSCIHPFLIYLLTMRGIHTVEEVSEFLLGGEWSDDPMAFADMDKAVDRIHRALDAGESMAVYGDYDADGVTSTAMLYSYLRDKGARVSYLVPEREGTGYGMHKETVDELADRGVTLIITVDNGITAVEEVASAAQKGIDVVVTDHHRPQEELPDAIAVVDPHRVDCGSEWKEYAGVGVAFKLICALEEDVDFPLEEYADLVAIGTLADVMPLQQENRMLVRAGLHKLNTNPRLGLSKLAEVAGVGEKEMTASSAVYTLAPRINAAGRMGSADKAVRLLLSEDVGEAAALANEIQQMNIDRQATEATIMIQVEEMLSAHPDWLAERVLVISGDDWHCGVIGIIAARITERYGKPCILFSVQDGIAKGSGRSIKGFSLFDAIASCAEYTESFGGHELAAGVSVAADRVDEFRAAINRYAAGLETTPVPELTIDCKLRPSQVDVEKLGLLAALEPTGAGNPAPLFGLYNMRLDNVMPVGNGKHLRLSISREDTRLSAMKFQSTTADFSIPCGTIVNLVVSMEKNEYHGVISPSLIVKDIRPASIDQESLLSDMAIFGSVQRREGDAADTAAPTREELGGVYRFLRAHPTWNGPVEQLYFLLQESVSSVLSMLLCLQVLHEAGLIIWQDRGILYHIETPKAEGKTDLMQTPTMQFINEGHL